jgi:hypothetical protein
MIYSITKSCLTTESNIENGQNDCAVNIILNSVSKLITLIFGNMTKVKDMWETLFN